MFTPIRICTCCTSTHVLRPFDKREAITTAVAAENSGLSARHVRRLAANYDLGQHIGGGMWRISREALAAFLDGNVEALQAYHAGNKVSAALRPYYARCGIAPFIVEQAA